MCYEVTRLAGGPLELQAIGPDIDCYYAYLIDLTRHLTVAGTPRGYIFYPVPGPQIVILTRI